MAIGLVTALVVVAWRFGSPEQQGVRGVTPVTSPAPAVQQPQASGTARLEIRATKGDSYLIVRSRSALGSVLYQGTVEKGQQQRFEGRVLWVQLESPQNVLVKLNGNRVALQAAVKAQGVFVTAKKIFPAEAR
jgi:hypothetical protein